MFGTFRRYVTGALIFFFSLGILTRIVSDQNSPGLIRRFFDALAGLFTNTING